MSDRSTYVFGTVADSAGIIRHTRYGSEPISGGGLRAWKQVELDHEPGSAYAPAHPAPMPLRWGHGEDVGRVLALRRDRGRLLAVGELRELEPADLEWLTEKYGDLRFSSSTNNRRGAPLLIDEISLTPSPATNGLPAVRWYKLNVTGGNMPPWVKEELRRADKTEYRSRHELQVNDLDFRRDPYSDPDRYARDVGLIPGERTGRQINVGGEWVEMEYRPGRITAIGGRRVNRD